MINSGREWDWMDDELLEDGVDYLISSQGGVNISGVVDIINKLQ